MPEVFMYNLMQQMMQPGSAMISATFLAGMLAIAIWRRDGVRWSLYRVAVCLYAASLIVPSLLSPLIRSTAPAAMTNRTSMGRTSGGDIEILPWLLLNIGPALLGGAVLFGLLSLCPSRYYPPVPKTMKHPLD